MKEIRCSKCNKPLKHPKYIDGKPYGSICYEKVISNKEKHLYSFKKIKKGD